MNAAISKIETNQDKAISAWQPSYMDSDATAHMAMNDSVLWVNKKSSNGSIITAKGDVQWAKSEVTSEFQLSDGTGLVRSDWILHFSKMAHNLVSENSPWDDGLTVQITESGCVINMKKILWVSAGVPMECTLSILKSLGRTNSCPGEVP